MKGTVSRLGISLVVYAVWVAVTAVGGNIMTGGKEVPLEDLVKSGVGWNFVAAIVVLLVAIAVFKWNDLRFKAPHSLLRTMWFPSIYLIGFAVAVTMLGLPPVGTIAIVLFNTLLVGFSEETMFRGILFRAFEERMAVWPAIILTSALFGAVHLLNVFTTGELFMAAVQSLGAALSGLVFIAIMLRTGSIWPAIVYHGLWDCGLFMFGVSPGLESSAGAAPVDIPVWAAFVPVVLNLPNVIFALIMLRNIGKRGDKHVAGQ